MTGYDDLLRTVEVCGLNDCVLRGSVDTELLDLLRGQSYDSRHGADPDGDGFLHEAPTLADEMHRISKAEGSCADQSRVFTQAVARCQYAIYTMIT